MEPWLIHPEIRGDIPTSIPEECQREKLRHIFKQDPGFHNVILTVHIFQSNINHHTRSHTVLDEKNKPEVSTLEGMEIKEVLELSFYDSQEIQRSTTTKLQWDIQIGLEIKEVLTSKVKIATKKNKIK